MADQFLNKAGLSRLWAKIKAYHDNDFNPMVSSTTYGPLGLVSLQSDYSGIPIKSCQVSGASDTVTVYRTGKNLIDQSQLYSNGGELVWEGDKAIATATNAKYCMVTVPLLMLRGGYTYTLSCYLKVNARASVATGPYEPRIMFRNDGFVVVKSNPVSSDFTEGYVSVSYAVKSDTNMYLGMLITGSTAGSAEIEMSQLQLEVGSTSTTFEEYQGGTWTYDPTTAELTPPFITSLEGTNYIWANEGDVTVEYGAYLQTLQKEIELLSKINQS